VLGRGEDLEDGIGKTDELQSANGKVGGESDVAQIPHAAHSSLGDPLRYLSD
jgi:hypothetical protein